MLWISVAVVTLLAIAVVRLWWRLESAEASLVEVRAVVLSLPEVAARLEAARARRDAAQDELERDDARDAATLSSRQRDYEESYSKYGLTPPRK